MRIAIVGAGISGLVVASLLHDEHDIVVYEAQDRIGGHTHTIEVDEDGRRIPVDTGFIVFNERNYPNFCRLLKKLGVSSEPSDMSFSVRDEASNMEYAGSSLNSLFAQRRNLLRPGFYRMLRDILRFYKEAPGLLATSQTDQSVWQYLSAGGYSAEFIEKHIVPMGAAIWSSGAGTMRDFPLRFFLEFFQNHGMLSLKDRPRWRCIEGGSREYVRALVQPFQDRIRLATPVLQVSREESNVFVTAAGQPTERFDRIVLACHSDQALNMLTDTSEAERAILSKIPYQTNDTVLHTDASLLPRCHRARASWNYNLEVAAGERVTMTYYMNRLQNLQSRRDYCVTLNRSNRVDDSRVLERMVYEHPVFTTEGIDAQAQYEAINGVANTYFCGAYWGYGFHEDGVNSALRVCDHFGKSLA